MLEAQQYNLTMRGLPKVLDWVVEHTRRLHNPSEQHQTVLTGGSNYTIEVRQPVLFPACIRQPVTPSSRQSTDFVLLSLPGRYVSAEPSPCARHDRGSRSSSPAFIFLHQASLSFAFHRHLSLEGSATAFFFLVQVKVPLCFFPAVVSGRAAEKQLLTSTLMTQILTRLFLEAGDDILCEEYTYPHVPESMVLPAGYRSVAVKIDDQGIIPELLLHTLEAMVDRGERTPKLLYTIPVGQNPTGEGLPRCFCSSGDA